MRDPDDDGYDFPPSAHPNRELFTAALFTVIIIAFVIWGAWKLLAWL